MWLPGEPGLAKLQYQEIEKRIGEKRIPQHHNAFLATMGFFPVYKEPFSETPTELRHQDALNILSWSSYMAEHCPLDFHRVYVKLQHADLVKPISYRRK